MEDLICTHCGDIAIESSSDDGMFYDGDGGKCISCGFPGQVVLNMIGNADWMENQDLSASCDREDCRDCVEVEMRSESL